MPKSHPTVLRSQRLTADELRGFSDGVDAHAFTKLGAHVATVDGQRGAFFGVWAPDADAVAVTGDFNGWHEYWLERVEGTGVWDGFVPNAHPGNAYKYRIRPRGGGPLIEKQDPYGFLHEVAPKTASIVASLEYAWGDEAWLARRKDAQSLEAPISIYELHLGSWMRVPEEGNRSLGYREIAPRLAAHVKKLGFTHVELMPVMEHPFVGSWGYQVTGYFAPTYRLGGPQDLMFLIDHLHQEGIGVILDWVPAHFPSDAHSLGTFDGSHLYEHADPREGYHPDWNTLIFNYGRHEVKSFLLSSALFWLDVYHVDCLRVDGVASMLYRDYSRKAGEWVPNQYGGRENLEAVDFLRKLNALLYLAHPDTQTMAEESTSWPNVSKPEYLGGLGFGFKWDMGWMNDTLDYMEKDPLYRSFHHDRLTFRSIYAHSENFVMPLSHDEVVYGKGSLIRKMPGDTWQKFANLRLLYAYQWAQPGKKLLFMGGEIAQWSEWNHDGSLDWHLADEPIHAGIGKLLGDLNRRYRTEPALYQADVEASGFEWIDGSNSKQSIIVFARHAHDPDDTVICAFNFTPEPRKEYRIGVPRAGKWREILNSDAKIYEGSGHGNMGAVDSTPIPWNGRRHSINVTLPPLGAVFFKPEPR